jgi:hypothetical protein
VALSDALAEALGEPVSDMERLSAGASRETWSLATGSGKRLVLQRRPARHRERPARLGFADDASLAAAIRSGMLDGRLEELECELRSVVADKLAVARPEYPERGGR